MRIILLLQFAIRHKITKLTKSSRIISVVAILRCCYLTDVLSPNCITFNNQVAKIWLIIEISPLEKLLIGTYFLKYQSQIMFFSIGVKNGGDKSEKNPRLRRQKKTTFSNLWLEKNGRGSLIVSLNLGTSTWT